MSVDRIAEAAAAQERRPSAGEVSTAIVHLYRAEAAKAEAARRRLDTTTNWAVVTMAATTTFALGADDPERHVVILLNGVLATFFLLMEARRYRFYDIWQTRARLMESDFFAPMLWPEGPPCRADWRQLLAMDLRHPTFHVSLAEAVGWRLRRNYGWIYAILLLTWLIKLTIHPETATSAHEFLARAAFGPVPGWLIVGGVTLFYAALVAVAVGTRGMRQASGEIMPLRETHEKIESTAASAHVAEVRESAAVGGPGETRPGLKQPSV